MSGPSPTAASVPPTTPSGPSSPLGWRSTLNAIPDLALAAAFLVTWVRPFTFGETAVQYFLLTMLLEFIIVHSSAFMGVVVLSRGDPWKRAQAMLGLGAFYSLFVVGFAVGFHTWWPLLAFWGLTLNRLLGIFLGDAPRDKERLYVRAGWAMSALLYLLGAFATVWLPVPELGVTAQVRRALALPGGGLWIDEPHRVLAFGVLYFGLTGLSELRGWTRTDWFLKGIPSEKAQGIR